MSDYCIKNGYICNLDAGSRAKPFLDDVHSSSAYQVKVYELARDLILRNRINSVLDVGCGYAMKLRDLVYPACKDIVGIDTSHAIDYCHKNHHFGQWFVDDIEKPTRNLGRRFDLIIASDVIEHLVDPDKLFEYIRKYCHKETYIIISTPERDFVAGKDTNGPPLNPTHVREWNMSEFRKYVNTHEFFIIDHRLVGERYCTLWEQIKQLIRLEPIRKIQVVLCHPFLRCGKE